MFRADAWHYFILFVAGAAVRYPLFTVTRIQGLFTFRLSPEACATPRRHSSCQRQRQPLQRQQRSRQQA